MAELRRSPRALRGAAVVAGLAVVAASATQAVTTMSAPDAVRTATQNVSTANYFPAPLPTDLTCTTNGIWGTRSVTLRWTAPPRPAGAAPYRYLVTWSLDAADPKYSFDTANTTTGEFRIRDQLSIGDATAKSYRIFVRTINPDDPSVVSSGSVSWTVYSVTGPSTYCTGDTGFRVENQAWENQREWTPEAAAAPTRAGRMFISIADALNSGALADVLTDEEDLGELADVPPPAPAPDSSDSADDATSPDPAAESQTIATSTPAEPGAPADPEPSDDARPASSGPAAPPESSPAEPPTPTASPPLAAALGAGPIAVGAVEARLEEVDGQPEVIVNSGGVQVCIVAVPGATAIESSAGVLTVTGAGPDRVVDTATCELS